MKILTQALGGRCFRAKDKKVDMICHTDFFWETDKGILCSIDKKMMKKTSRTDKNFSETNTWLELIGNEGNKGSACCHAETLQKFGYPIKKEHDYLMVESKDYLLMIQRYKSEKLLNEQMKDKEIVYFNPKKEYIPYQRKNYGHQDICMLVPFTDLEKITQFKILKPHD